MKILLIIIRAVKPWENMPRDKGNFFIYRNFEEHFKIEECI